MYRFRSASIAGDDSPSEISMEPLCSTMCGCALPCDRYKLAFCRTNTRYFRTRSAIGPRSMLKR